MSTDRDQNRQTVRTEAEHDTDPRVDLAVQRTELALERTQLAWIRTTFSLYTAGIALDKGLEALHQARMLSGTNWANTGHTSGRLLTLLGTALAIIATVIYFRRSEKLAAIKGSPATILLPAGWLSAIAALLGALLFVLMITTG